MSARTVLPAGLILLLSISAWAGDALVLKDNTEVILRVRESGSIDAPFQSEAFARAGTQGPVPFDTYVQVLFANVVVDSQQEFSLATSWFTAAKAGTYLVSFYFTLEQSSIVPGQDYHPSVCVDAVNNPQFVSSMFPQKTAGNADHPAVTSSGLVSVNAGQRIGLCFLHGSSSGNPIIRQAHLRILKVK
jgi:hypothetical protein